MDRSGRVGLEQGIQFFGGYVTGVWVRIAVMPLVFLSKMLCIDYLRPGLQATHQAFVDDCLSTRIILPASECWCI